MFLGQVVRGLRVQGGQYQGFVAIGGQQDDGQLRVAGALAERGDVFQPATVWQLVVQQDTVEASRLQHLLSFAQVTRGHDAPGDAANGKGCATQD